VFSQFGVYSLYNFQVPLILLLSTCLHLQTFGTKLTYLAHLEIKSDHVVIKNNNSGTSSRQQADRMRTIITSTRILARILFCFCAQGNSFPVAVSSGKQLAGSKQQLTASSNHSPQRWRAHMPPPGSTNSVNMFHRQAKGHNQGPRQANSVLNLASQLSAVQQQVVFYPVNTTEICDLHGLASNISGDVPRRFGWEVLEKFNCIAHAMSFQNAFRFGWDGGWGGRCLPDLLTRIPLIALSPDLC